MRTKITDPEILQARMNLRAMERITRILETLSPATRDRVLIFIQEKLRHENKPKVPEATR